MTSTSTPPGLARFNALEESAARAVLLEACASTAWARRLLAARPYATADDLYAPSDAAMAQLTADDLGEAMGGHPRSRPRCSNSTWRTRSGSAMSS